MSRPVRLLYLSFAFPPGMQALFPALNAAGNGFETRMVNALRQHFAVRSAGILPLLPPPITGPVDPASGVPHEAILLEKKPELLHRYRSLAQLKAHYSRWVAEGWMPDVVFTYCFSPIYNYFIRWLSRQNPRPRLVLFLGDGPHLGEKMSAWRRFRYRFKPLTILDEDMLRHYDACVGASPLVAKYFVPRKVPFFLMPGAVSPHRARRDLGLPEATGPIRFGYFGSLAPYTGVVEMLQKFLALPLPNPIHVCGHGKLTETIAELARANPRLHFHGLLPTPEDCLDWAVANCDVMINPRPPSHGNENTFPSKLFEYGLTGRAILASRLSGVESVLGPEAFYYDPADAAGDFAAQVRQVSALPRVELRRRGGEIQAGLLARYDWASQAAALAGFMKGLLTGGAGG